MHLRPAWWEGRQAGRERLVADMAAVNRQQGFTRMEWHFAKHPVASRPLPSDPAHEALHATHGSAPQVPLSAAIRSERFICKSPGARALCRCSREMGGARVMDMLCCMAESSDSGRAGGSGSGTGTGSGSGYVECLAQPSVGAGICRAGE